MTETYPPFPRYAPQRENLRDELVEALKTFTKVNPPSVKAKEIHIPPDIEAELADYDGNVQMSGKTFADEVDECWKRLMNVRPALPQILGLRVIWDAKELKVS